MIDLPFPNKILWPNGSQGHRMAKVREAKKHRAWAHTATLAARPTLPTDTKRISWVVHPKPRGPAPDKDNCSAAAKSYQDGICAALDIDDKTLAEPRIIIGERVPDGRFVATLDSVE